MDVSSQMGKPKKQKLDGGGKSLSNLPDVVIGKILSLLPTRDAIRTSILSKRWEYLWTSLPNLDFTQWNYDKKFDSKSDYRTPLVNFVERALALRGPVDVKQFTLSFEVKGNASRVNSWVSAILRGDVEKISLGLYTLKELSLPRAFFTCPTLTNLDLDVRCIFKVPSNVCFSSLRSLTLASVAFSDECSIQQLFSGCPVLEELTLHDCNWANLKYVSICAPKLLKLTITENDLQIPSGSDGCQIMVFGVSLGSFSYVGECFYDYCLYDSSVSGAHICVTSLETVRHMSYRLYKLLLGLSSLKFLAICATSFEVVQTYSPELLAQMPLFKNLTSLVLECEPVEIGSRGLLRMLQNCPCLETVLFVEGINLSSDDGVLEPLPPCFFASLEEIEVCQFRGDQEELSALKILLKNAMVLKKMSITCSHNFQGGLEKISEVNKQLSDLPRGSESCEIVCRQIP